jgi:uncharacterized membrane protein YfcA
MKFSPCLRGIQGVVCIVGLDFELLFLLFVSGLFSGFLAGLLGIGGGIILVPMFWFLFSYLKIPEELTLKLSIGTSLAVIAVITLFTSGFHILKGKLRKEELLEIIIWIVPGIVLGVLSSHLLPSHILKKLFAGVLLVVGIRTLKGVGRVEVKLSERILAPVAVILSAFLSSLLGIGGGIVINSFLFSLSKIRADKVVAMASVVSFFNATLGSLMYMVFPSVEVFNWQVGYVYFPAVVFVSLGSIPGSRVGLLLLHRLSHKLLKKIFAILLIIVAIKILFV